MRPSSDTATHAYLYRVWEDILRIVHTWGTLCQQLGVKLTKTFGATWHHPRRRLCAYEASPARPYLTEAAVAADYECETGKQIEGAFPGNLHRHTPMAFVAGHAPLHLGKDVYKGYRVVILEELPAWLP